jgi:hypothetical protein
VKVPERWPSLRVILSDRRRRNDWPDAIAEPVDNGDQIGEVLALPAHKSLWAGKNPAGCD